MKQFSVVLLAVLALTLSAYGGYYWGQKVSVPNTPSAAERNCQNVMDAYFPKPAAVMKNAGGSVKGVYGALLSVEMNDPSDYLPHTDGSPRATLTLGVNITKTARIIIAQSSTGKELEAKLSDIKTGDQINFWSDTNIQGATEVNATKIQIIR